MEGHDEELTIDVPEPLPESAPTLKPPAITTVGTEEQWEKLIQQNQESNKALVVDFRSTWCKPSLVIAPFFEELSGRFPAAVFARVDVDELEVRDRDGGVQRVIVPSFKVFKGGKVVDELSGATKTALESMVAKHASD